jgi:putative hydrolase of the HAD superfamily
MFSSIKHIFFDLDDTLWDFEKNSSAVIKDLFHEYELALKLKTDFDTFHQSYKEINNNLWRSYHRKEIDKQFLRNNRFHLAFQKFSYNNFEENLLITELYLERSPFGKHLKDGCLETLSYLATKYQLHLITNGFKEVQHIKLNNCGLKSYFKHIIISEEHNLTKPDVKIFRLAESLVNSGKEHCLMVGDNYESDIEGAANAGWKSVYYSNAKTEQKTYTINHLLALKEIL